MNIFSIVALSLLATIPLLTWPVRQGPSSPTVENKKQTVASRVTSTSIEKEIRSHFYLGGHQAYTVLEFNNPSKLKGFLTGAFAAYKFEYNHFFFNINWEGYWTTGGLSGDHCQLSNFTENLVYLDMGYMFPIGTHFEIGPYLGTADDMVRNSQNPQHGPLTYHFRKIFLPAGIKAFWNIGSFLSVGLVGQVGPDVYSKVHVTGITVDLHKSRTYRAEMPLIFHINSPSFFSLHLIPYYDRNQFGKAAEKNSRGVRFPIPELTRWEVGLRLLADFHF